MVLHEGIVVLESADVHWVLPVHHEAQKEVELFVHDALEYSASKLVKPPLRHQGFEVSVVGCLELS